MGANATSPVELQSKRLQRLLERDPTNLPLLSEAASAAYEESEFDRVTDVLARYAAIAPLSPALQNLSAIVALAQGQFANAAVQLKSLINTGETNPALRFNLAWAKAMMGSYRDALDLLDDSVVGASPRGPALKIHMMHHLGSYDEGLACGAQLAERYPDNRELMGALATSAMDAERIDLAHTYAERAGGNPEGVAALGLLKLGDHDAAGSLPLFEEVIRAQPKNPRAWVGKGLALLSKGEAKAGAAAIDQGAALFEDHVGSWIASGWAHFIGGDYPRARASFERALAIDPNFAESHGALAVLDVLAGNAEAARRHTEIALRLDKNCFGAALAKTMLLERSGHAEMAQKVRNIALNTPVGPGGQTIVQALAALNGARRK